MLSRVKQLLALMNQGIYEKDTELSMALLAALAGESIILLGPPGVAKSMVARRLKMAFRSARSFEYLMSRFSTPDELFGPISISRLKESDSYERALDGYLPTADVVFLDEIWKAGPAIQNTLLTAINEKIFRNGRKELHLPLKLLVAASNELPTQGEGLEALWDRFMIRLESHCIRDEKLFNAMLLDAGSEDTVDDTPLQSLQFSAEEYASIQQQISAITVSDDVLVCISSIRKGLDHLQVDDADELRQVYVSDRRWKNIVRLLRTSAFMQDRQQVEIPDMVFIYHCLWSEPEERDAVRNLVLSSLFTPLVAVLGQLKEQLADDIRNHRHLRASNRVTPRQRQRDANKKTYSNFYYRLPSHDTGHTFVVITDYQQLPSVGEEPASGILYHDRRNPKAIIIRLSDTSDRMPVGSRLVSLCRDDNSLVVDGIRYDIELQQVSDELPFVDVDTTTDDEVRDYPTEIDALASRIRQLQKDILESIFVSDSDRQQLDHYLQDLFKELAFTRQDTQKLYE